MKQNKVSVITSVIFALWFILSLGGIFLCCIMNTVDLGFIIVGQYFLIMGVFMFWSAKQNVGIFFAVVGMLLLIGIGINKFGTEALITLFNEKFLPLLGLSIYLIIGLCIIAIPRYFENKKKKRCTLAVEAKCEGKNESYGDSGNKLYSPVWSYYVGGKQYTYSDNVYSIVTLTKVGDTCTLYINPDDFNDVYKKSIAKFVFKITFDIMGIFIVATGVFAIYGKFFS